MPELSLSSMDKIIRKMGNERVSKSAAFELRATVESFGEKIAKEAIRKAEREGVKTVGRKHIKEAVDELEK